jgi:hypothetical protein
MNQQKLKLTDPNPWGRSIIKLNPNKLLADEKDWLGNQVNKNSENAKLFLRKYKK